METLQIRLSKELLNKVDQLVATGLFRNRSEILRQALQEYIVHSNYNGALPFIVGPFADPGFDKALDLPLDALSPEKSVVEDLKKRLSKVKV